MRSFFGWEKEEDVTDRFLGEHEHPILSLHAVTREQGMWVLWYTCDKNPRPSRKEKDSEKPCYTTITDYVRGGEHGLAASARFESYKFLCVDEKTDKIYYYRDDKENMNPMRNPLI